MSRRHEKSSYSRITYPQGCKELSEELSKEELLKRLKLLAKAFQEMAQDESNASEYKQLALYLATEFFLDHSNKDVRLLVACCIADIFRVFAPEAPFTDAEQVKEIFSFLAQQLKGLSDPDSVTFKRYFYLLENLATVKSFNICLEFDDAQDIFVSLFKMFFGIVNEKHSSKVTGHMLDIMTPLIVEADSVSQDLIDVILGCILEPFKTQNRPAYHLARDLIKRTADALEPYIQTFFNNTLMLGKTSESELADRVYDLIQELNNIQPSVLLSVLPQLEFKLKSGDEAERTAVTRVLGKMFSAAESELATLHRPLWMCFLGRFNDIATNVRRICVQASQEFLVNHCELVKDVTEHLQQRQHDSDEDVRMDVVQAIVGASKRLLTNISTELLDCVRERTLDKKFKIRKEALVGLGQIYRRCCDNENVDDIERISWVRNKVLHAYYHNSVDDRILVERILNTSLVPFSLDVTERMKRLYLLYANLDEHAVKALNEIFKTQLGLRTVTKSLLESLQRGEKEEMTVNSKLVVISRNLPEPLKAQEHLKKFVKIVTDDVRIRGQLLKVTSPDCECKKAEESVKDILKKLGNPVPQNALYMTVKSLLERMAPVLIDGFAVTALLKLLDASIKSKLGDDGTDLPVDVPNAIEAGMKLLLLLSSVYPVCFQQGSVYESLLLFFQYDDESVVENTLQIFKNIGQLMEQTHSNIFSKLLPALTNLVKTGSPKHAKYAIRCIDCVCKSKETVFKQLYEHMETKMDLESANFLTALVAIGHLAQLSPTQFATSTQNIVSRFVVKELLMQVRTSSRKSPAAWCADHLVSDETQAKIEGLKMIVRWLTGMKSANPSTVNPTLRLLYSMILSEGDLTESKRINKAEMARLRLQAGCCMLKLAQEPVYAEAIKLEQFQTMALLAGDECLEVRTIFVQKLHKGLISLRLPLQYLSVLCLTASDSDKNRRSVVRQMLVANINRRREYLKQNSVANTGKVFALLPDYVVPYAIHLLAHDPDLTTYTDVLALSTIKECLWFLMEPLIKNDNFSFSFYKKMLEKIKQSKDALCADNEEANKKLYAVCDLASSLLLAKTSNMVLKDSPAEPLLPQKLFTAPDMSVLNVTVYLPKELQGSKVKKPGTAAAAAAARKRDAKSPESPVSSNPSSPVSSTKSSPQPTVKSRPNTLSKLQSARAAQGVRRSRSTSKGGSSVDELDVAVSPGSSKSNSFSPPADAKKPGSKLKNSDDSSTAKRTVASAEIKKTTPARKSPKEPTGRGKTVQGKISDYVRPSTSTRNTRSRQLSGTSADSSRNGPSVDRLSAERLQEDSAESSDEEKATVRKRSSRAASKRSRQQNVSSDEEQEVEEEQEEEPEKKTKKRSVARGNKRPPSVDSSSDSEEKEEEEEEEIDDEAEEEDAPSPPKKTAAIRMAPRRGQTTVAGKSAAKTSVSTKRKAAETDTSHDTPSKRSRLTKGGVSSASTPSVSSTASSRNTRQHAGSLLNGTSEAESSSPSKKSSPSPSAGTRRNAGSLAQKRRVGAAAKAAQKYADFEVTTKSPVKKR